MTQRRERKEERKSRDLRRFKDSRTLREREEDAEEHPKGGCSKSRGDEGELRRLAGWLCQSTSMYLAEECKRGAKVTFLTVDSRVSCTCATLDAAITVEIVARTERECFQSPAKKYIFFIIVQNRGHLSEILLVQLVTHDVFGYT